MPNIPTKHMQKSTNNSNKFYEPPKNSNHNNTATMRIKKLYKKHVQIETAQWESHSLLVSFECISVCEYLCVSHASIANAPSKRTTKNNKVRNKLKKTSIDADTSLLLL